MIEPNDSYDPRNFDILLTDVVAEDIHENIPRELNVRFLSDAPNELDQDIGGIMYGRNLRLFCATTVSAKNKIKMVIFLVDTGSPTTYISEEVLFSFGIEMVNPVNCYTYVNINKRYTRVMMSHSHFNNICVIGMDFLNANSVGLHAFCGNDIFFLNFGEKFDELRRKKKRRELIKRGFMNIMGWVRTHSQQS